MQYYTGIEYTPEVLGDFYKRLARPIELGTQQNIANFRRQALQRGLTGTPYESLGTASLSSAGTQSLSDLWANLNWQKAMAQREERLGQQNKDWQALQTQLGREWQSQEAQKQRDFQRRMAELQRKWQEEDSPGFLDFLGQGIGSALPFAALKFL